MNDAETERDECALPASSPLLAPSPPKVLGVDLAFSRTGLGCIFGDRAWTETIRGRAVLESEPAGSLARLHRIDEIGDRLLDFARGATLVVVEGPSYFSAKGGERGHHERGGLWWDVARRLYRARIPFAVASPKSVKLYATGKGGAPKDLVLAETVRRFGMVRGLSDNNEADALVLAAMGSDWLGYPVVKMPELHRRALPGVDWRITGNPGPVAAALEAAAETWARP